ncbi:MAG: OmpA family protein [Myxococcota bacterium]
MSSSLLSKLAWLSVTFGVGQLALLDLVLVPSYIEASAGSSSDEQVREDISVAETKIAREGRASEPNQIGRDALPPSSARPSRQWVVLFGFGRTELTAASQRKLKDALQVYKTGYSSIFIEGHTDTQGDPAYNKVLSRLRAEAVAEWFFNRGVPRTQLTVRGLGDARAVEAGRARRANRESRRVEIILEDS